jgi:hypothetical protein
MEEVYKIIKINQSLKLNSTWKMDICYISFWKLNADESFYRYEDLNWKISKTKKLHENSKIFL